MSAAAILSTTGTLLSFTGSSASDETRSYVTPCTVERVSSGTAATRLYGNGHAADGPVVYVQRNVATIELELLLESDDSSIDTIDMTVDAGTHRPSGTPDVNQGGDPDFYYDPVHARICDGVCIVVCAYRMFNNAAGDDDRTNATNWSDRRGIATFSASVSSTGGFGAWDVARTPYIEEGDDYGAGTGWTWSGDDLGALWGSSVAERVGDRVVVGIPNYANGQAKSKVPALFYFGAYNLDGTCRGMIEVARVGAGATTDGNNITGAGEQAHTCNIETYGLSTAVGDGTAHSKITRVVFPTAVADLAPLASLDSDADISAPAAGSGILQLRDATSNFFRMSGQTITAVHGGTVTGLQPTAMFERSDGKVLALSDEDILGAAYTFDPIGATDTELGNLIPDGVATQPAWARVDQWIVSDDNPLGLLTSVPVSGWLALTAAPNPSRTPSDRNRLVMLAKSQTPEGDAVTGAVDGDKTLASRDESMAVLVWSEADGWLQYACVNSSTFNALGAIISTDGVVRVGSPDGTLKITPGEIRSASVQLHSPSRSATLASNFFAAGATAINSWPHTAANTIYNPVAAPPNAPAAFPAMEGVATAGQHRLTRILDGAPTTGKTRVQLRVAVFPLHASDQLWQARLNIQTAVTNIVENVQPTYAAIPGRWNILDLNATLEASPPSTVDLTLAVFAPSTDYIIAVIYAELLGDDDMPLLGPADTAATAFNPQAAVSDFGSGWGVAAQGYLPDYAADMSAAKATDGSDSAPKPLLRLEDDGTGWLEVRADLINNEIEVTDSNGTTSTFTSLESISGWPFWRGQQWGLQVERRNNDLHLAVALNGSRRSLVNANASLDDEWGQTFAGVFSAFDFKPTKLLPRMLGVIEATNFVTVAPDEPTFGTDGVPDTHDPAPTAFTQEVSPAATGATTDRVGVRVTATGFSSDFFADNGGADTPVRVTGLPASAACTMRTLAENDAGVTVGTATRTFTTTDIAGGGGGGRRGIGIGI